MFHLYFFRVVELVHPWWLDGGHSLVHHPGRQSLSSTSLFWLPIGQNKYCPLIGRIWWILSLIGLTLDLWSLFFIKSSFRVHLTQPLGLFLTLDPCQYVLVWPVIFIRRFLNRHDQMFAENASPLQGHESRGRNVYKYLKQQNHGGKSFINFQTNKVS